VKHALGSSTLSRHVLLPAIRAASSVRRWRCSSRRSANSNSRRSGLYSHGSASISGGASRRSSSFLQLVAVRVIWPQNMASAGSGASHSAKDNASSIGNLLVRINTIKSIRIHENLKFEKADFKILKKSFRVYLGNGWDIFLADFKFEFPVLKCTKYVVLRSPGTRLVNFAGNGNDRDKDTMSLNGDLKTCCLKQESHKKANLTKSR
jgi:hypothetical protein